MPVPATTGQLRTKVEDMEIGDYIPWLFDATFGHSIGGDITGRTEIPVSGLQSGTLSGKYYAYGIKIDKGLIVSDRVHVHSKAWDSLNNEYCIEGSKYYLLHPLPTDIDAFATFNYNNGYFSYTKLAKNSVSFKSTNGVYAQGNFTVGTGNAAVFRFKLKSKPVDPRVYLQCIFGSSYYYDLIFSDTQVSVGNVSKPLMMSDIIGKEVIVYHDRTKRLVVVQVEGMSAIVLEDIVIRTATWATSAGTYLILFSATTIPTIVEFEYFQRYIGVASVVHTVDGVIRSLAGGVAYADINGNMSLTDKGLGAWPTDNEWDKYIVSFPTDKIQSGKTLDDVFHHEDLPATWTKDTVVTGVVGNNNNWTSTNSTVRMRRMKNQVYPEISSVANVNHGFRPVFEYKEV